MLISTCINGKRQSLTLRELWTELAKDWPILERHGRPIRRNVKFLVGKRLGIEEILEDGTTQVIWMNHYEARKFLETL